MKKILFIIVLTIFTSNVYAKWNDGLGDDLATGVGAAIGTAVGIATENPWIGFGAGTAAGVVAHTGWNYMYDNWIPNNWKIMIDLKQWLLQREN